MTLLRMGLIGLALLVLGQSGVAIAEAPNTKLTMTDCHLNGIKAQVRCGTLQVPENYSKKDGPQLSINFAILPAIDNSKETLPLMFLAGGPGQAAVEMAGRLNKLFTEARKTRDIIMVDQRGTGKSHPLECPDIEELDNYTITPEEFDQQEIKDCIAQFTGDLSQFNSENAIRDFDAIRAALGHKQLNLYGGSYGTRAALVYMRLFPQNIRSVVLDSVGPIEVPIGLFGQSSARSFELLLKHCQEEETCNQAYPQLTQEFKQLINRLEQAPVKITIPHPRLGTNTEFAISKGKVIGQIRAALYGIEGRSMVPLIVHQAFLGNYLPLAGMIAASEGAGGIYPGLLFNITCNEDYPRINDSMFAKDAANSFGDGDSHTAFKRACPVWPKYTPSKDFYNPVTADIPTLIMSGDLDPVTPPSNGEYSAKTLPNSHHIVVEQASHGAIGSPCAVSVMQEFLTTLKPKELDQSCFDKLPKETFMSSLNGGNAI
ncbi:MAG: alpha/beta hydrolase [Psychrosphaera sp.]|nr:alpha/beta hydrolase [Psychrosphaera sp.]